MGYDSGVSEALIFVNPIAGRGRARALSERISRALSSRGVTPRLFTQPAYTVADADLRDAESAIATIVIGGDGTLRAAVERMLWKAGGDGTKVPPVLTIGLGTANLMARHLGLRWGDTTFDEQLLSAIESRRVVQVDTCTANDRLFLLMVGVGIDAAVVHELDQQRTGPIDLTSYALPSILAMQRYDYPPLTVTLDGKVVHRDAPAMAFIGNVPEYGTGFPILNRARPDDELLDLCILPCRTRAQVVQLLMATATGNHVDQEGVIYLKGRSIRIESPRSAPVQIDGEASGHTPIEVNLLPTRVPFIVHPE